MCTTRLAPRPPLPSLARSSWHECIRRHFLLSLLPLVIVGYVSNNFLDGKEEEKTVDFP